jgi:outer membrane protein assembly factor BamB
VLAGEDPIVFQYWVGDDVDGSIVVDEEGMLYVPVEYERYNSRAQELGQLIKLNPYEPDDPYVWGMFSLTSPPYKGGMWTTPALTEGVVYAVTNRGFLVAVDRETGEEAWSVDIGSGSFSGPHHMSSPIVVDDRLVVATASGKMQSYDITDPRAPILDWEITITAGSIEATPAAWDGMIYIGSRDGFLYGVGD